MNIGNLELNKKYKNYKEMCDVLGEKIKTGKSKILQLKDWKRFFNFEKEGNSYYILEIYSTPHQKVDNRKGNTGTNPNSHLHSTSNFPELDILLMDYINKKYKKKYEKIYVSNNVLSSCTITNYNYYNSSRNPDNFYKNLEKQNININNIVVNDLFQNINNNTKGIIQTSLRNLSKKYKLEYSYNYILIILEKNIISGKIETEQREADPKEIEIIEKTTKEYINVYNFKNDKNIKKLNDVNYLTKKLQKEFYQELDVEVFEKIHKKTGQEIKSYFKGYIINSMDFSEELKDNNVGKTRKELNNKFLKNNIENLKRRIDKKEIEINKYLDEKLDKVDIWGTKQMWKEEIVSEKFGERGLLIYQKKYKNEYVRVLGMLF